MPLFEITHTTRRRGVRGECSRRPNEARTHWLNVAVQRLPTLERLKFDAKRLKQEQDRLATLKKSPTLLKENIILAHLGEGDNYHK